MFSMENRECLIIFLFFILVNLKGSQTYGISAEQDLTLTYNQKLALDEFKDIMMPYLEKDYMKTEVYLVRWLRTKGYSVDKAVDYLKRHLKWRQDYRVDSINEEDWKVFKSELPYYNVGFDKDGRPIYALNVGDWDLRRAILSGNREKVLRWLIKGYEDTEARIRELQVQGKNVTRWRMALNLNGFTPIQHLCGLCLPIYLKFVTDFEENYPGLSESIMLINTPQIFDVVLSLMRPLMSPETREALLLYGKDWEKHVYKFIEPNELPPEFGGHTRYTYDY